VTASDVEASIEAAALRLLGYGGVVVGPVDFGAVRFRASMAVDDGEVAQRPVQAVGALDD
jgi:hypothetical protein